MRRSTPRLMLGTGLCVLVACLSGCSPNGLPTAPGPSPAETQIARSNAGVPAFELPAGAGIAISPRALAKPARARQSLVAERRIGPSGGLLALAHKKTSVAFWVPPGALNETTVILMRMIGDGPSVVVQFEPGGLYFLRPCTLTISLPAKDADPDDLNGYLITDEGAVPVPSSVKLRGRRIIVQMSISHFSLYSPSDGEEFAPADDDSSGTY